MNIQAYLDRINYSGPLNVDYETLRSLHRAHLLAIPYENFDIHLGRTIQHNETAFYDKLVTNKRGGWCYEMNGLFAWALRQIGFEVKMLYGSVRPDIAPDGGGNHLVLLVELDRPYVVDVGFGDGFIEPLPLEEGEFTQLGLTFRLTKEGDYWICHNHPYGGATRYDFNLEPYQLADFVEKSHYLQTSPDSGFTRATICERFTPDSIILLRGAIFKEIKASGVTEKTVESEDEFKQVLAERFGLDLGDTSQLWSRIQAAHQAWLASQK